MGMECRISVPSKPVVEDSIDGFPQKKTRVLGVGPGLSLRIVKDAGGEGEGRVDSTQPGLKSSYAGRAVPGDWL